MHSCSCCRCKGMPDKVAFTIILHACILDPWLRSRNFFKYGYMYWNSSFNVPNTFTLAKFIALNAVALVIGIWKVSAASETTALPCGSALCVTLQQVCNCIFSRFSNYWIFPCDPAGCKCDLDLLYCLWWKFQALLHSWHWLRCGMYTLC